MILQKDQQREPKKTEGTEQGTHGVTKSLIGSFGSADSAAPCATCELTMSVTVAVLKIVVLKTNYSS